MHKNSPITYQAGPIVNLKFEIDQSVENFNKINDLIYRTRGGISYVEKALLRVASGSYQSEVFDALGAFAKSREYADLAVGALKEASAALTSYAGKL